MKEKIHLLIADDHQMVREGLKAFIAPLPDFELVGEARNGEEAVALADRLHPDIILMDLVMPVMNGIEATRAILKADASARVLIITSFTEDDRVIAAIQAGAVGYLLKDSSPQQLIDAILDVYERGSSIPAKVAGLLMRELKRRNVKKDPVEPLTEREIEILKLVAKGASNQNIADTLTLSVRTVGSHLSSIFDKLNLENRTQAVLYALREGIVKLDSPP